MRVTAAVVVGLACAAGAAEVDAVLRGQLEQTYGAWRKAVVERDARTWEAVTASHRRMAIRNRIVSEKREFPAAVFDLPASPPGLGGLRAVQVRQSGPTAKAVYFGKVDFGIDGEPSDNLLVISFVNEGGRWRYDTADFVNLGGLPDVRRELAAGDDSYVEETKAFVPDGKLPPPPLQVGPAKYIAKVYVFCPGREVQVQVNKVSRHAFLNTKQAEVVLGGARDGANEVQYSIRKAEGGKGTEALAIRVYLMSEMPGTQPLKAFEYQVEEGRKPDDFGTGTFNVDAATAAKLAGGR